MMSTQIKTISFTKDIFGGNHHRFWSEEHWVAYWCFVIIRASNRDELYRQVKEWGPHPSVSAEKRWYTIEDFEDLKGNKKQTFTVHGPKEWIDAVRKWVEEGEKVAPTWLRSTSVFIKRRDE